MKIIRYQFRLLFNMLSLLFFLEKERADSNTEIILLNIGQYPKFGITICKGLYPKLQNLSRLLLSYFKVKNAILTSSIRYVFKDVFI